MNRRRRIQPKATVELETVALQLPSELVRALDQYGKYPGGNTDRTHVSTQALETALAQDANLQKTASLAPPASCPRTLTFPPALSATLGGPSFLSRP